MFFICSHCWMSQTPTVLPTARLHSFIRKTRGSMRREWQPSWSRAGWTSELPSLSAVYYPSSPHHVITTVFFLPYPQQNKGKKNSYIWRTHTPPRETRNNDRTESNQTGLDINFANTWGKQLREIGFFFLLGLLVINFTFCIAWCEISYF